MSRDDFFTQIHKALRKALFDVTVSAGACDWSARADVDALLAEWRPLHELLLAHSGHEDDHFFALAEAKRPGSTAAQTEEHTVLDPLLDAAAATVERAAQTGDAGDGLVAYRSLASFVAVYLPHLHAEETVTMPVLWETCTDEELAECRARFLAQVLPEHLRLAATLMLDALPRAERAELEARIGARP